MRNDSLWTLFVQAFNKWSDFENRATRKEFVAWFVFYSLCAFVAIFLMAFVVDESDFLSGVLLFVWVVFSLICMVPSMAITVRRLHDLGYSGWVMVGVWALILFSDAICTAVLKEDLLSGGIGIVFTLYLLCAPSKPDNRFGPNKLH